MENWVGAELSTTGVGSHGIVIASGLDLAVTNSGTITTTGTDSRGIYADAQGAAEGSTFLINGGTITATGARSMGIEAYGSGFGNPLTINATSVTSGGEGSTGIYVNASGKTTMVVGTITTTGDDNEGLISSGGGDVDAEITLLDVQSSNSRGAALSGDQVDLEIHDLQVTGGDSWGVYMDDPANAGIVNLTIHSADVTGAGSGLAHVQSSEEINATFGTIVVGEDAEESIYLSSNKVVARVTSLTSGVDYDPAIEIKSTGTASLAIGKITTTGNNAGIAVSSAVGAEIRAAGAITVGDLDGADGPTRGGEISTTGNYATGLSVWSESGAINVDLASISTDGAVAHGVFARSGVDDGPAAAETIRINVGQISTDGSGSNGMKVLAQNADVDFGTITQGDASGVGIFVETTGEGTVDIKGDAITTKSDSATGVQVRPGGDAETAVIVNVGSITTEGMDARGVQIDAHSANVTVDTVSTKGLRARGVHINVAETAVVKVTNSIVTEGASATAIYASAASPTGAVSVDTRGATIETRGRSSIGIDAFGDTVTVLAGSVATTAIGTAGLQSHGITVDAVTKADVTVVDVATAGELAHAVSVAASGVNGAANITSTGHIRTTGKDATAVIATIRGEDGSAPAGGKATLRLNTVSTSGTSASAVYASAETVDIAASRLETSGHGSVAVTVSESDNVLLNLTAVKTTGQGARGVVVDATGDITLVSETISTTQNAYSGQVAHAVDLTTAGGTIKVNANSISTGSVDNAGVRTGSSAAGVLAHNNRGSVLVEVGQITTFGEEAHALDLTAHDGGENPLEEMEIRVLANTITTDAVDAIGIKAFSDDVIDISVGTITGKSMLIDAVAEGQITMTVGHGASATTGSAVRAIGSQDITFNVATSLSAVNGTAAQLEAGRLLDVTIGAGAEVRGGTVGLQLSSEEGTTLDILGSISAASGLAFNVDGAAATVNNRSNTITGRIDLTENSDTVNNSGTFNAIGISDFGGTADADVFNNTGLIDLGDGTAARSATFANLETLNNSGVIDLANGRMGDTFTVSGVLDGRTGNTVLMDLDVTGATPVADLISAGRFTGVSNILLSVQGRASLGDVGVVIGRSGSAQTGAEFDVEVAGGGFIRYDLDFANGEYRLNGDLAPPAFEPTKVAAGAQHQWNAGADMVSARLEQIRDEVAPAGLHVWSQVYGGAVDIEADRTFSVLGESFDADISHEVKSRGVQAGIDRAVPIDGGSLVFGMLVGAGKTELEFQNGDVTDYDGVGVGAYAHWVQGPLTIGALAKVDTFKLDYDWAAANLETRSSGFTTGARLDAAWRIETGGVWFVEPQASVSWSDTALGRLKSRDNQEVVFGDTTSLIGRIGVRAGATVAMGDGMTLRPYAGLHAMNEFDGENASTLLLGDDAVGVSDEAPGAWGRATLGAGLSSPSGLGGFIQAESDFGEAEGFTARVGVNYRW